VVQSWLLWVCVTQWHIGLKYTGGSGGGGGGFIHPFCLGAITGQDMDVPPSPLSPRFLKSLSNTLWCLFVIVRFHPIIHLHGKCILSVKLAGCVGHSVTYLDFHWHSFYAWVFLTKGNEFRISSLLKQCSLKVQFNIVWGLYRPMKRSSFLYRGPFRHEWFGEEPQEGFETWC